MSSFTYVLPENKIAQRPVFPQDEAKLLIVDRSTGVITDSHFKHLPEFLREGDALVFNNTRVRGARLFGALEGSEKEVELFFESQSGEDEWICFGKPLKKLSPGKKVFFTEDFFAVSIERIEERRVKVKCFSLSPKTVSEQLSEHLLMPIPPYIRGGKADKKDIIDYQPIFAQSGSSIASPTASLHFTQKLLEELAKKNVSRHSVHLELGASSIFALEGGPPSGEIIEVKRETLEALLQVKKTGRVVGVGTTVVRALESCIHEKGFKGETKLFIEPGFVFSWIDCLITNFHQPGTTHLLLLEAFLERELLEKAYAHALTNDYRFLSYGDGMLII